MQLKQESNNLTSNRDHSDVIVCLKDVSVAYGKNIALYKINLDIEKGEFIGIVGPNGSGKTTLLKTVLGLIKPIQGNIRLFNQNIDGKIPREIKNKISYIPQFTPFDKNFPALVEDVVMMGRYNKIGMFRVPSKEDRERVKHALKLVKMDNMAHRPIGHLSGGQQQKVMIAQALATSPSILLLDEPTSALDFKMTKNVMDILTQLNKTYGITIVTIHHNLRIIKEYTKRVIAINKTLVYDGSPNDSQFDEIIDEMYI
ncbi:MAG: metal ABC transporter ATP-binding protein [Candidatus Heimdallarchaeaceae archaeon]